MISSVNLPIVRILRLVWLIGIVAVIVGSLAPAQSGLMQVIGQGRINDKVEHFTAYAVLAAIPSLHHFRCRRLRATIAFLFCLGAALEVGQLLSRGRSSD